MHAQVFFRALGDFVRKNATSYFMLNLSDLKPAVFMVILACPPPPELALNPTIIPRSTQ